VATSLRNGVPLSFVARTLSDATDATNAGRGAMRALANLVPDPTTRGNWVCRPGQVDTIEFSSLNAATFVTAMLPVGNIVYGMVSSGLFAGKDQPFAYDLDAGAFLAVAGIEDANLPVSPPATGHWTPPIMAQVGSRILVTHTGFPGSTTGEPSDYGIKFGWFDISDFEATITGNTIEQFAVIGDTVITDNPLFIYGVPPGALPSEANIGFTITGTGIPASTTIVDVMDAAVAGEGDTTAASAVIVNVPSTSAMYVGMVVEGAGIPPGSQILLVGPGTQITLDQNATATATGVAFSVIGKQIQISNPATSSANGTAFTFFSDTTITGNPSIFGLQPGLAISGTGVAAGTTIVSFATVTAEIVASITANSNSAFATVSASGLSDGMDVAGAGIAPGTTLLSAGGNLIVLSLPALSTGTTTLFFSGTQIEVSPALTGTHAGVELAIVGGTPEAPLWGAGDTAISPLPSVPVGVAQMNGRAWFAALENGIPWSDSLLPCVRTSATQALTVNNARNVTAIAPLMLAAPIVGGIVQALVAFQGGSNMQQITGDPATGNLKMDLLPVATGTLAPNTITPSTLGTFFVSPEGLRVIDFKAGVSDPIGQDGEGVISPFLSVVAPPIPFSTLAQASRMAAAAGGRTLRIDAPDADGTVFSYWYDLTRRIWTGPHTGGASLVEVWNDTFLVSSSTRLVVQRADDIPRVYSVYEENGQQLLYEWETSLLPDSGEMSENTIIESAIMVALQPLEQTQIDFLDEIRGPLDGVTLRGLDVPEALWGRAIFGVTLTGPDPGTIRQRQIPWTLPLVFKQGRVNIRGLSSATVTLGNFYMRYQVLGYLLQVPQIPVAPADGDFFLLANDGVTILRSNGNVNMRPDPI